MNFILMFFYILYLIGNNFSFKYFAAPDRIIILVLYNGKCKFSEKKNSWSFNTKESLAMQVSNDITYMALLDQLYEEIGVQRSRVDMQLKVLY